MTVELRELMVYQSPPELGALYTEVEAMMQEIGAEQSALITKKMKIDEIDRIRRRKRMQKLYVEITLGIGGVLVAAVIGLSFVWVVYDRIEKYPHLGTGFIPKTEEQQRQEAEPKVWIGR
jgi:hypothetical protein